MAPASGRADKENDSTARSLASDSARGQSAAGATREEDGRRVDSLDRLKDDPSPAASRLLRDMYKRSKSKDARFWIVQALGSRLREKADAGALDTLFVPTTHDNLSILATGYYNSPRFQSPV